MKPVNGLPEERDAGRALRYLEESEEAHARAVASREAAEAATKIARDSAFLASEGTVAERQALAGTSLDYRAALEKLEAAYVDLELLKAKRQRAILTLEVWRSLNSNRRAGIV
jgi:hypothetical protein